MITALANMFVHENHALIWLHTILHELMYVKQGSVNSKCN